MTLRDLPPRSSKAHELLGDFWFNSDPVPVSAQRGRVILLFFWDYSCVHCLRALPYVRAWERTYRDFGLVTVGVHAPRFAFGRDPENVRRALGRHGVRFPIVTDNDLLITARYDNRAIPAIYLIDAQGFVRVMTSGEGEYASVEHMLHALLYETGVRDLLPLPMAPLREEDRQGAVLYRATPEIFTGYLRGSLGNVEGYSPESVVSYADPGVYMDGRVYADGLWLNDRNCLRLSQDQGGEGHLVISYHGLEAGAVISPDARRTSTMEVRQDGRYLTAADRGADVQITPDGRSIVVVESPRFYELVRNREFGEHVLRLTSRNPGNAVYSFAFITGIIPETVNQN
jgi:thiol-disulfide isomerase/thioredoxin